MKFHFSLQKVLDVKEIEKEQAQQEFGTVKRRQMELEEKIRLLAQMKESYQDEYDDVDKKKIVEIIRVQEHITYIDLQLKDLTEQRKLIKKEVDRKQIVLVEKAKEEKMWQEWKAKSLTAFQKQVAREEQAMLDEMAVLRHFRHM